MAVLAGIALLASAPAAGAEIVYVHGSGVGSTLVAMNDDGSGAHVLLSAADVPPNDQLTYPSVAPDGTTLVFQGLADEYDNLNGPPGDQGANYGGLYTLSSGVVMRISAPPAPVANAGSEDTDPSVTADGRVVYETLGLTFYSDGSGVSGYNDQLLARPLAGGTPSEWTTSPPTSFARDSADPANAAWIAYTTEPPIQLVIGAAGAPGTVVASQPHGTSAAFSPDGTQLVDADWTPAGETGSGYSAGIWLFPAQAGATGREVVADPSPPASGAGTFNRPTFVGASEIVFQATVGGATNLYEVPTSCEACAFSQAKQLTSDGTASAPDTLPAWTSQTIAALGQSGSGASEGSSGPTGAPGGPVGHGSGGRLAGARLSRRSIHRGKPVTFEVTLTAPTQVRIRILRLVRGARHGKRTRHARFVVIGSRTFHGKRGLNRLRVKKLHGRMLAPGRYEAKVSAGGRTQTLKFTVRP